MKAWRQAWKSQFLQYKVLAHLQPYAVNTSRSVLHCTSLPTVSIRPIKSQINSANKSTNPRSHADPTIYALSTATGRAAIAIIRISGSACLTIYQALCPGKPLPRPRHATLRTLHEPNKQAAGSSVLDASALILHFPAPATITGEDVLELHIHGGTAVVKAVLAAIPKTITEGEPHIIRYAEPGEFTRRAFYNNRLDLLQIEALGDTLSADTEQQRRLAIRGATATQAKNYEAWRQQLLYARGELEALIDFSEDQHFDESPSQLCASVAEQVQKLKRILQTNIENSSRGELLRNGINIALVGAPNAGKSSLLNQIVGREAAIVSSEAGTTRDVVDVNVDIGGYFCRFGDLAGLRSDSHLLGKLQVGEIEKEGMRRAKERARTADVVIAVFDLAIDKGSPTSSYSVKSGPEVTGLLKQCSRSGQEVVYVINKTDLVDNSAQSSRDTLLKSQELALRNSIGQPGLEFYWVSCKNAQNLSSAIPDPGRMQEFLSGLTKLFGRMTSAICPDDNQVLSNSSNWAESLGATERQRILLRQCLEHLESFLDEVNVSGDSGSTSECQEEDIDIVLAAESLRAAADCLSKITGKGVAGDVEEVLGVVFEKYVASGFHMH